MQVNYRAYPHPVLSYFSDDYVRCLYQTNVRTTVSKNAYTFAVMSKTSSAGLKGLLASGDALHAIHVECNATRFRRLYTSKNDSFNIEIPSDVIDGKVFLCSFIVAAKDLECYKSDEFHSDFEGRGFLIRKGDVLAVDKDRSFIAEKDYDPLRKLPSIFTIASNLAEDPPPIDIDCSGNKVVIRLSNELHSIYKKLAADTAMSHILSSLVVVPALISLLEMINSAILAGDISEIEERRWFRVLSNKLKDNGYLTIGPNTGFTDSTLLIAQKLIGHPLLLGMRGLSNILEDTGEDE
jgi:hypothetical protein